MLLSESSRISRAHDIDSIHNYYEHLVFDAIHAIIGEQSPDADHIADIACIALNHLPPRYVRHDVDMAFYQSPAEREEMLDKISNAVQNAIRFIEDKQKDN